MISITLLNLNHSFTRFRIPTFPYAQNKFFNLTTTLINQNRTFATEQSQSTKQPNCTANDALAEIEQRKFKFGDFVKNVPVRLQFDDFIPRYCSAAFWSINLVTKCTTCVWKSLNPETILLHSKRPVGRDKIVGLIILQTFVSKKCAQNNRRTQYHENFKFIKLPDNLITTPSQLLD